MQAATVPAPVNVPPVPKVHGSEANGKTICLDPGHPSETSEGCKASGGPTEMHVNWVVAVELSAKLKAAGYKVVITKKSETEYVTNRHRAETANEAGAAILVIGDN